MGPGAGAGGGFNRDRVSVLRDEDVLEVEGGDSGTATWMSLSPSCTGNG